MLHMRWLLTFISSPELQKALLAAGLVQFVWKTTLVQAN